MITHPSPLYRTISGHSFAEVRQHITNKQKALFSTQRFSPGEQIALFSAGTIGAEPTYLTVQVDTNKHITLDPEFLQYINHSCDPNVFFNTSTMELVALKEIGPEEEMTFFYPSTEWQMIQSFNCYCGSPVCIGEIRGAAFLTEEQWKQYRLTDFIQQQRVSRDTLKVA